MNISTTPARPMSFSAIAIGVTVLAVILYTGYRVIRCGFRRIRRRVKIAPRFSTRISSGFCADRDPEACLHTGDTRVSCENGPRSINREPEFLLL